MGARFALDGLAVGVVGAGVVGLTAALALADRGAAVTVLHDRDWQATTSRVAGAVWEPYLAAGTRLPGWAATSYRVLRGQAAAGVPGVSVGPMVMGGPAFESGASLPAWTAVADGVAALGPGERPPGWSGGFRYDAPLVRMDRYLPWLVDQAVAAGCRFERRRVGSFDELAPTDAVVDCAGLGARELAGDPSVVAVRGQVVAVAWAGPPGATVAEGAGGPPTYAIAHPGVAILGGSADEGCEELEADPVTTARILADAATLVPGTAGAEVLGVRVGLRPWRPEVRVEVDPAPPAGIGTLVHDYGHGGCGVTLSWGCAAEVADLVAASTKVSKRGA